MSDLQADALATLEGWTPPDARQSELRERYVAHLREHPDGVRRSCTPAHLTAGVLVLDADGRRVLLNLHRKARRWFHFGGHLEPDDATLAGAALREGREESGIDDLALDPTPAQLDSHLVAFCGDAGEVEHLDVRFVARAARGSEAAISEESLDVRWFDLDALPADLEPQLHALIAIALSRSTQAQLAADAPQSTSSGGGSIWEAADQPSR